MNFTDIDNIIFDLGGVIINLDIDQTFKKFSEIFQKDVHIEIFNDHHNFGFFRDYEVGNIDSDEFRVKIKDLAGVHLEDRAIDDAWNAMLLDIPGDRINWIYETAKAYNCVVLSNTNHIHVNHFEKVFQDHTGLEHPRNVFQKLYYSFEINQRKPNPESFRHVLDDTGFNPSRTVLFDDLQDNLDAARQLGIQTVYVEKNKLRKEQLPNGK